MIDIENCLAEWSWMNNEDVSTVIITLTNNFSVSAPHLVCPRAPEYIEAFFFCLFLLLLLLLQEI